MDTYQDGHMRNQNMWRWNDNWWKDQESHITVLYTKDVMREGFAGEEATLPRIQAEEALERGFAVLPNEELMHVLPCWNPDTLNYDRLIERTPHFLSEIARKRQWIDTYWRMHDCYLESYRVTTGFALQVHSPPSKLELARIIWQQTQVRINPAWITFRYSQRRDGLTETGHSWFWIMLPGGTDIEAPDLIYHNDRVRVRIRILGDIAAAH